MLTAITPNPFPPGQFGKPRAIDLADITADLLGHHEMRFIGVCAEINMHREDYRAGRRSLAAELGPILGPGRVTSTPGFFEDALKSDIAYQVGITYLQSIVEHGMEIVSREVLNEECQWVRVDVA